ncbi:MAG: twin-arginine translocase TatA/TatE family subunit [Candidatus Latescibacteria bacterium]|nr:twin-arginine translocase TatA/TatE family subunit [Candidatus Latescibacterota bacterium]
MLGGIGPLEIGLILLIVLLLFGAKRIPEIARSLGRGIKEFKKGVREVESEMNEPAEKEETPEKKELKG